MSKPKLDEGAMRTELAESAFFRGRGAEPASNPTLPPESPKVRDPAPPPVRRRIARYAFEFYQDQLDELRRLSLEEKLRGGKGSMSEMVRAALDRYLAQGRSGK